MDECGGGEGRKEKHPAPHTALNNKGLLGVWAICELGDRDMCGDNTVIALGGEDLLGYNSRVVSPPSNNTSVRTPGCVDLHENICKSQN